MLFCATAGFSGPPDWGAVAVTETLGLFLNDRPVGVMTNDLHVVEIGKRVGTHLTLTVNTVSGNTLLQAMSLDENRVYDWSGRLVSAMQSLTSPAGTNRWELLCDSTGKAQLIITTGGIVNRQPVMKVTESIRPLYLLCKGVIDSTIKKGDTWIDTSYDLMSGTQVYVKTICKAIASQASGNRWIFGSNNSVTEREERWELDKKGKTLYREIPPFFTAKPLIGNKADTTENANIFEAFGIPASRAPSLDETIGIVMDSGMTIDSTVRIFYGKTADSVWAVDASEQCQNDKLPIRYSDSLKAYLQPTVTIQSDAKQIKDLALSLKGKEIRTCGIIRMFNKYVYEHIMKKNTATFSSAIETLNAGFGDCGEHAVLLTALLRAAGIPSRVVLGLVYIEGKGYLYHAWVMAWSKGWIFTDPALGIYPSPDKRIPIVVDDTGQRSVLLAKYIGRIRISYVKR